MGGELVSEGRDGQGTQPQAQHLCETTSDVCPLERRCVSIAPHVYTFSNSSAPTVLCPLLRYFDCMGSRSFPSTQRHKCTSISDILAAKVLVSPSTPRPQTLWIVDANAWMIRILTRPYTTCESDVPARGYRETIQFGSPEPSCGSCNGHSRPEKGYLPPWLLLLS